MNPRWAKGKVRFRRNVVASSQLPLFAPARDTTKGRNPLCPFRDIGNGTFRRHSDKEEHRLLRRTTIVYTIVVKNITLSADEHLIEQARLLAKSRHKTLNAMFREW